MSSKSFGNSRIGINSKDPFLQYRYTVNVGFIRFKYVVLAKY